VTLKEYDFLQYRYPEDKFYIEERVFEEIERFVLENEETTQYLKITTKRGYGKVLQAQNYVGVIQTKGGTTIEILPKITNVENNQARAIVISMLKTLKNSPFKSLNSAHLKNSKMPLFEIFIAMFLDELALLIRKGIRSDYLREEDNLKFLKGKLMLGQHLKYNHIHKERFFVEYEEYSSDRIENRLIKSTLQYLYKKLKSTKNQQRIREFLFVFDEVGVSHHYKEDFKKIKINRQMKAYAQTLLWCKTFLLGNSFSPYRGNSIAFALLFDMNLLFESYVFQYLKRYGRFENITAQDGGRHLAYLNGESGKFRLKPDIVINKGTSKVIIADTKWKILSEEKSHQGVSQSDMYQLFAYGTKYKKCKTLFLIYPKDEIAQGQGNYYEYYKTSDNRHLSLKVLFFDVVNPGISNFGMLATVSEKG